jgi:hypothetical protein
MNDEREDEERHNQRSTDALKRGRQGDESCNGDARHTSDMVDRARMTSLLGTDDGSAVEGVIGRRVHRAGQPFLHSGQIRARSEVRC